jgi:four helix bundle protein
MKGGRWTGRVKGGCMDRPGSSEYDRKKQKFRERTKKYASKVIRLYCKLPIKRAEVQVIGKQLLRSGTSVAANYREASRARSDAEFVSKIDICAQEADESCLWLELLRIAIFVTMSKNVKKRIQK